MLVPSGPPSSNWVDRNNDSVEEFLELFQTTPQTSSRFATSLTRMWPLLRDRSKSADIISLQMAIERRRLMLCNTAAWLWLMRDCVNLTQTAVQQLQANPHALDNTGDWLSLLVRDIYLLISSGKPGTLRADAYLDQLAGQPEDIKVTPLDRHAQDLDDTVCGEMSRAVVKWLSFPTNTHRLSAYFVIYVVQTFQSCDVLLFHEVWRTYSNVITVVLRRPHHRNSSLTLSMLEPFCSAIQQLPLTETSTEEACVLRRISDAVNRCLPNLRDLTQWVLDTLMPCSCEGTANLEHMSSGSRTTLTAVTSRKRKNPTQRPRPSSEVHSQDVPGSRMQGLQSILRFIRALIPLVTTGLPARPTQLQTVVSNKLDFYLPFRECAPS